VTYRPTISGWLLVVKILSTHSDLSIQVAKTREQAIQLQSELHLSAMEAEKRLTDLQMFENERNTLNDKLKAVKVEVNA